VSSVYQLDDGPPRDEVNGLRPQVAVYVTGIRECLSLSDPEQVYWVAKKDTQK
jgi:hypothetical protein